MSARKESGAVRCGLVKNKVHLACPVEPLLGLNPPRSPHSKPLCWNLCSPLRGVVKLGCEGLRSLLSCWIGFTALHRSKVPDKKKKSEKGQAKTQLKHQKPESEPQGELVNWVYGSFKTSPGISLLICQSDKYNGQFKKVYKQTKICLYDLFWNC